MNSGSSPELGYYHAVHSTLRENIIEHLFVGELLRRLWQLGVFDAEILKSGFDAGGYDLVLTHRDVTRHIQLKVSREKGARAAVGVGLRLGRKPSGCVVWLGVDDSLAVLSYRWFGGLPGQPLPDISAMPVARHAKGDAKGVKNNRENHRVVSKKAFKEVPNLDALILTLLGDDLVQESDGEHLAN